jgi:hypothetical protein
MTHELATMTTQELQEAIGAGLISIADAMAEIDRRTAEKDSKLALALAAAKGNGRTIKANNAGGLFIRDSSFKAWSEDKSKEYTGCLNMDPDIARALVNNDSLLQAIRDYLNDSGLTKFPKKNAKPAVKTDQPKPDSPVADSGTVASTLTGPGPLKAKMDGKSK